MAQFFRKSVRCSSGIKNGHVALRQGDWFQFEGDVLYTAEFMDNFYCCRQVERSKMQMPQEWQLDLYAFPAPPPVSFCYVPALRNEFFRVSRNGNGLCGPFAGPQCIDCLDFQRRYVPRKFNDQGYKNLMPVHGNRAYLLRFLEICGGVFEL